MATGSKKPKRRVLGRGTCSVCNRTIGLDLRGNVIWHRFPDSLIKHPTIHHADHCMGFGSPPREVSDEGRQKYLAELECLLQSQENYSPPDPGYERLITLEIARVRSR